MNYKFDNANNDAVVYMIAALVIAFIGPLGVELIAQAMGF